MAKQHDQAGGAEPPVPAQGAGPGVNPVVPGDQPVPDAEEAVVPAPAPQPGQPVGYDVREGLYKFCSAQAKAMLAQYENINHLLGPTDDWTAPGTLCEVLIRDLIRRNLPSRYSVDKGFIFGRRKKGEQEIHCPEIDLLIHDTFDFRPIYRLEDFVIVEPRAVRGLIQVKRVLDAAQLKDAIDNLADAKCHLRDCWNGVGAPRDVFTAAIFFGDRLKLAGGGISGQYKTVISAIKGDPFSRPDFVGSLAHRFYLAVHNRAEYIGHSSAQADDNAALTCFLGMMCRRILPERLQPDWWLPDGFDSDESIQLVANPPEPVAGVPVVQPGLGG